MAHRPRAIIRVTRFRTLFRFSGIGDQFTFDTLIRDLRAALPNAVFDWREHSWTLPTQELPALLAFLRSRSIGTLASPVVAY